MEERTFSQEELNSIVGDRLSKEKEKYTKQISELENRISEYESKVTTLTSQYDELNKSAQTYQAKLKEYDTQSVKMRVAHEFGIPYELATRISGESEDDIRKDAESLKKVIESAKGVQPLRNNEPPETKSKVDSSLRELAEQLAKK